MDANDLAAQQLQKLQGDLPNKRVLIVDRHPEARNSLRMMLSTLGITTVHGAGSSIEVLRQVKSNHYDIIFSDYLLDDGRDGQQLLEELRYKQLISLSTVFMVITAERSYKNVVSVAELIPDDYLIKPFTGDQLQQRLGRALFKKHIFFRAYQHMEKARFDQALESCNHIAEQFPAFQQEAQRLRCELLNSLGRYTEAESAYRQLLADKDLPWARMGLAVALHGQGQLGEALPLVQDLVKSFPEYLAAYDFLARLQEESGLAQEAQHTLQEAAVISPNNTLRQRSVGDMAIRNNDLEVAEKAFQTVLTRGQGSSLRTVDDYANLSRVLMERGNTQGVRRIAQDLRRDWRGNKQGEMASLILESLALAKEGEKTKSTKSLEQALALHQSLQEASQSDGNTNLSQKLAVDLAQACMANGQAEEGEKLMRQVAAENNEDRSILAHIQGVFAKNGNPEAGQALLEDVNREIVEINNQGVTAARTGDLEGSVDMLMEAAERVPNLQFLINAADAIYSLMDAKGWKEELAVKAHTYLEKARAKNPQDPRVITARQLYQRVAAKYGINTDILV